MINWTKDMIEKLKTTTNLAKFSRDNNISVSSARKKRNEILPPAKPVVEQVTESASSEAHTDTLDGLATVYIPSIVSDVNKMLDLGIDVYLKNVSDNICLEDNKTQDILHFVEIKGDEISDKEKLKIFNELKKIRKNRRVYKNESEFLGKNKSHAHGFIEFIKTLRVVDKRLNERVYSTRILKGEFGNTISSGEQKEALTGNISSIQRKLDIQKVQKILTDIRQGKRMRDEDVATDKLKSNWRAILGQEPDGYIERAVTMVRTQATYIAEENNITLDTSIKYIFQSYALPEVVYQLKRNDARYIKGVM